jgi:hypothetical protein
MKNCFPSLFLLAPCGKRIYILLGQPDLPMVLRQEADADSQPDTQAGAKRRRLLLRLG